jgi:hypothetical protein
MNSANTSRTARIPCSEANASGGAMALRAERLRIGGGNCRLEPSATAELLSVSW